MKAGLGAQRREPLTRVARCAVEGCNNWTDGARHCNRCAEEIAGLEELARERKRRAEKKAIEK